VKTFSLGLRDHGVTRIKNSGIFYRHLRLIKQIDDFGGQDYGDLDDRK
jgi:hypothetical protein